MPSLTRIVAALPATTPFVGPETLERRSGVPLTLRLGANESLFGPSPRVLDALRATLGEAPLYGDPEGYELRHALARHHGLTADHLVLGAGIDELLGVLVQAYIAPGDAVVMSTGGYPTFAYQARGHGGVLHTVPYRADRNDAMALVEAARRQNAKLLYLSNPDNPTGSYLTADEQRQILDRLPPDCLFLLDEAYAEFAPPDGLLELVGDDPRVIRMRTFSKVYGMAGLRVGYAMAAPELVRPFDRIRNQFGVGRLGQTAALAALADQDFVASVIAETAAGRAEYTAAAAELGLAALPSAANFVAIDLETRDRAAAVLAALQEREGVFVRMPGAAPIDRCIRVTIGRQPDRAAFAVAFRRVVTTF